MLGVGSRRRHLNVKYARWLKIWRGASLGALEPCEMNWKVKSDTARAHTSFPKGVMRESWKVISSPEQTLKKQLAADRERIIRAACAITKSVDFGQSHFAPEVSAIKPTMTEQYTNQLDATKESKNCARTHTSGCWVPFFAAINRGDRVICPGGLQSTAHIQFRSEAYFFAVCGGALLFAYHRAITFSFRWNWKKQPAIISVEQSNPIWMHNAAFLSICDRVQRVRVCLNIYHLVCAIKQTRAQPRIKIIDSALGIPLARILGKWISLKNSRFVGSNIK